jgi:hypothetical protein
MACVWHASGSRRCVRQCPVVNHHPQRWHWKCVKVIYVVVWHIWVTELCLGSNKLFSPHSFLSLLLARVLVSYHLFFISNLISILLIIIHIVFVYLIWLIVFFIFHVKFGPYYFDNSFSFLYIFLNSSLSICFKFIFMSNLVYIVFIVVCFVLNVFLLYFFQFNTLTFFLLRIFLCCFSPFYEVSLCLMARNYRFWRLTHIDFDFFRCFYKIYLFLILFFNI